MCIYTLAVWKDTRHLSLVNVLGDVLGDILGDV